jgi:hypothetical protein
MIKLYDKEIGTVLGEISDSQLKFLIDQLEEEGLEDRDYAITSMTISLFEGEGADPELVTMLRTALGERDEMSIYWQGEAG